MDRRPVAALRRILAALLRREPADNPLDDAAEDLEQEVGDLLEVGEVLSGALALAGAARITLRSDPEGADELLGLLEREAAGLLGRLQDRYAALDEERGALAARGTA